MKGWAVIGATLAMLAVIMGSFAAHGLGSRFEQLYGDMEPKTFAGHPIPAAHKYLNDFKTAADYQFWHAIGLLLVSAMRCPQKSRLFDLAGWCFLAGVTLFSGSLYILTLTAQTKWGMVAPFGGLAFIAGWFLLALAAGQQMAEKSAKSADGS